MVLCLGILCWTETGRISTLGVYFDGFTSKDKKSQALGVIHIIIFNIDPTKRYHKANMLQYAILRGPKLPTKNDMWTYIKPLYKELKTLEDIGMVVKCDDGCSRKVRVHCLMVTGDIPAVSSVAGLLGHSSLFPCRLCTIKKVLPRNSVTNNNNNNNRTRNTRYLPIGHSEEPRTKGDFRRQWPDVAVSGFCKEQNTDRKLIFLLHRMVCPLEQIWQILNHVLGRTFLAWTNCTSSGTALPTNYSNSSKVTTMAQMRRPMVPTNCPSQRRSWLI